MIEDAELLRRYAEEKSEAAFTEVVRRHIDFVYGAALRQTRGNAALAQEVTQAVFTDLAFKAAKLSRHEVVVGWLHTATRFAAAKALRTESRRHARDQEVHFMNKLLEEPEPPADWARLQPVLDEVLGELKDRERVAVLLRFFEKQPLAEIAAKLSLTETAARSCVDRALDKMRDRLARRGITSTTTALSVALANQVGVAAPVGLGSLVTRTALVSTIVGGNTAVIFMTTTKLKVAATAAVLLLAILGERIWRSNRAGVGTSIEVRTQSSFQSPRIAVAAPSTTRGEEAAVPEITPKAKEVPGRDRPLANRGRGTPQDALETFNWAVANGEISVLEETFILPPPSLREAEELLAKAPEEIRKDHPTPQMIAAALLGVGPWRQEIDVLADEVGAKLSEKLSGLRLMYVYGVPDEAAESASYRTLSVRLLLPAPPGLTSVNLLFQESPDGWRQVIPPRALEKMFGALPQLAKRR